MAAAVHFYRVRLLEEVLVANAAERLFHHAENLIKKALVRVYIDLMVNLPLSSDHYLGRAVRVLGIDFLKLLWGRAILPLFVDDRTFTRLRA